MESEKTVNKKEVTHDFKRWWNYKDVFEERSEQKDIFKHPAQIKVVCAGRRWGKSVLLLETCIHAAITVRDAKCWIIAPNFNRAKKIYFDPLINRLRYLGLKDVDLLVREGIRKSEAEAKATMFINKVEKSIKLKNNLGGWSEICLKSAVNEETLVGEGLDWFGLDEARYIFQLKPNLLEEQLLPSLTESEYGKCLIISTPNGRDRFWEMYCRGDNKLPEYDPSYKSWHFKTSTNPYANLFKIERIRRGLNKDLAKQEYDADFITSEGQVYKYFNRDIHLKPLEIDRSLDLCISFDFNRGLQTSTVMQVVSGNYDYRNICTRIKRIESELEQDNITPAKEVELLNQRESLLLAKYVFPTKEQEQLIHVLYSINNKDYTIKEQCSSIKQWLNSIAWIGTIILYGDASGEQKRSEARESNWQQIKNSFGELSNEVVYRYYEGSTNPSIEESIQCVLDKLLNDDNEIGIYFNNNKDESGRIATYPLVRDMEQVVRDQNGKINARAHSFEMIHNSDNLRYFCEYEFPVNQSAPSIFLV